MSGTMAENGEPRETDPKSIFIRNIPKSIDSADLLNLFKNCGKVDRSFIKKSDDGKLLFAVCRYENDWEAKDALTWFQEQPHNWFASYAFKTKAHEKNENANQRVLKEKNKSQNSTSKKKINTHANTSSSNENSWDTSMGKENTSTPKQNNFANSKGNKPVAESIQTNVFSIFSETQKFANKVIENNECKCLLGFPLMNLSHVDPLADGSLQISIQQKKCPGCSNYICLVKLDKLNVNGTEKTKYEKIFTNNKEQLIIGKNDQEVAVATSTNDIKIQKRPGSVSPKKNYSPSSANQNKNNAKKLSNVTSRVGDSESTSMSTAPKFVYRQFNINMQVVLTEITKLKDDMYTCVPISTINNADYNALLNDFAEVCNNTKGIISEQNTHGKMLAACVDVGKQKEWYRALQLPDSTIVFIDTGSINERSQISRLIQCPPQFCRLPIFATYLKTAENLSNNIIKCIVYETSSRECVLVKNDETKPFGSLHDWAVISRELSQITKNQESHDSKTNKDNHKKEIVLPQHRVPRIPYLRKTHETASSEAEISIKSGSSVIIVNYNNSGEVYIRKADENNDQKYEKLIEKVHEAGLSSSFIAGKPEKFTKVLVKYKNVYYRARVTFYDHIDETCTLFLYDLGKKMEVALKNVKKMEASIASIPDQLVCVSLDYHNRIVEDEPFEKIISHITPYILNKTVFKCTYNGENHSSPQNVQLVSLESMENLNEILLEITKPVIEQLRENCMELHELPVNYYSEMKYLKLSTKATPNSLYELTLLNTSEFAQYLYIACTLKDNDAVNKMKTLLKRINDYCKEQSENHFPEISEICLAYYEKNGIWHRAVVISINDDSNKVEVYFVDMAVYSSVTTKWVKKIVPEFVEALPIYALKCYIDEFPEEPSSTMITKTLDYFENLEHIKVSSLNLEDKEEGIYTLTIPGLVSELQKYNIQI